MNILSEFTGPNAAYLWEMYERYRRDPDAVDAAMRAFFEENADLLERADGISVEIRTADGASAPRAVADGWSSVVKLVNLANAIREYGHLAAQLDPLGSPPLGDPALELSYYGLTEEELAAMPAEAVGGPVAENAQSALEAIQRLREVYSDHTGYDFDHLRNPEEREWLRTMAESGQFCPPKDPINLVALLERLTQVEAFEQFLHKTFPGKTRFSIEGLDMMVPVLDEIVGEAAESGIYDILIGMAHRGRLNVLAHLLQKPYEELLMEFKDPLSEATIMEANAVGWTGDVKYHTGGLRSVAGGSLVDLVIRMAPNPSHLEHVNPVVEGMARAAGTLADRPGEPQFNPHLSLPIAIHGDAAFPAQGIVAETLTMSRIPGYFTGGTIHIIANNQLGFTTDPSDARSTIYASDLAKGFKIPIVHVNADDPIACIEAARLAVAYRNQFQKSFLIDLIGYRRYGHNEGDEPRFTQPVLYQKIDNHPRVRELLARRLVSEGVIDEAKVQQLLQDQLDALQKIWDGLKPEEADMVPDLEPPPPGAARRVQTSVKFEDLAQMLEELVRVPDGFTVHPRLQRALARRRQGLEAPDERNVDWGTAEHLAFASILADGTPIRFTGEDVERGTFSHRHAVLHDAQTGETYVPLHHLSMARASFEIHNSPLSENAAIGYEYGYNIQTPDRLVLWEAQYGDFINSAQAVIDEFVVSGRAKWGQTPSLVLLLPHGYEGQGPDHSSGRLERFLQLAAETNMRIANCTTAAQYFHLLRRQAALLETDPLPLVVMTPKSLLRHPLAMSSLRELAEGQWHPVIDDEQAEPDAVRRLILCSGKVYVDLVTSEARGQNPQVAIVRVEQLYPLPVDELRAIFERYEQADEVVWLQEEAENNGAWEYMRPHLEDLLEGKKPLRYIGRPRRASPAEGSMAWHQRNQAAIVQQAFATPEKANGAGKRGVRKKNSRAGKTGEDDVTTTRVVLSPAG